MELVLCDGHLLGDKGLKVRHCHLKVFVSKLFAVVGPDNMSQGSCRILDFFAISTQLLRPVHRGAGPVYHKSILHHVKDVGCVINLVKLNCKNGPLNDKQLGYLNERKEV